MNKLPRILIGGSLLLMLSGVAHAEANQVRFARQLGLGYLQFYVMQEKQLLEQQAARLGLGKVTASYAGMGTPTAITDALLSGNVDVVGIGLPSFLTMWDKTRGSMNVRGIVAMNRQPAYLTTRNPNIKSVRDFTDNDRIALPAPKVSVQAIMLQMIAEKTFGAGKFDVLDKLTVGMSHPDGTAAMLTGKLEITSHFTSAPFQYQQLENPAIRKVLTRPTGRTRSARSPRPHAGATQTRSSTARYRPRFSRPTTSSRRTRARPRRSS